MKKMNVYCIVFAILFSLSIDASAQSFLKKLSKGLENVNKEIEKFVEPIKVEETQEATEGSVEPSVAKSVEPKAESPQAPKVTIETPSRYLVADLIRMEPEGKHVVLEFLLTSTEDDLEGYQFNGGYGVSASSAYDNLGNQYDIHFTFGKNSSDDGTSRNNLPQGVPVKVKAVIAQVSPKATSFTLIKMNAIYYNSYTAKRSYSVDGNFVMKNMPIVRTSASASIPVAATTSNATTQPEATKAVTVIVAEKKKVEPIYKVDLKKRNLKASVKSIVSTTVSFNNELINTLVYSFMENGLLSKIDYKDKSVATYGLVVFTHNDKGQLIKRSIDAKDGIPDEEGIYGKKNETFTYNATGRLIESYNIEEKTKTKYGYNAKGWVIKESYFVGAKSINSPITYAYDTKGNRTSITYRGGDYSDGYTYDSKNRLTGVYGEGGFGIDYKYNTNDDPIVIDDAESGKVVYEYEYDSKKNWIKRTRKDDSNEITTITKRVFEYY